MARTPSNMLPLGTKAPHFALYDAVSQKTLNLDELKSPVATVIFFICNHCPFVHHINSGLVTLSDEYQKRGVAFIAINANDVTLYPEDAPDKMAETAKNLGYSFPYLFDETQEVARAYQAACTPDFYVFDKDLACVYRGQMDDSRPGNGIPVTAKDIREALDCLLKGQPVTENQKPSIGCNIKWK
jgi:peroxiredoxin